MAAEKPIILFIDELDRCRPDYAVDMLEVIKHVFDVENVKVVLVTNTKQLRAAINHRYGMEVDAQKYLDKFLKYSFALPDKVVARFEEERALVSVEYFKQLVRNSRMGNELQGLIQENEIIIHFIREDIIGRDDLSLRETERLVRFLELFHSLSRGRLNSQQMWGYKMLYIIGVFIFCFHPDLIDDINKNRTVTYIQDFTHYNSYWRRWINEGFREYLSVRGLSEIDGVLSILKDTFRILSLEQTPQ